MSKIRASIRFSRPARAPVAAVRPPKRDLDKRAHPLISAGISLGFLVALIVPCFVIKTWAPETPAASSSLARPTPHAVPMVDAHKAPLRRV